MVKVKAFETRNNSFYKTKNYFTRYSEFTSVKEYLKLLSIAKNSDWKVYLLGDGSNTFFKRKKISSFVIKNRMESVIKNLGEGIYWISSSVKTRDVLSLCHSQGLDSFYYLSSVPGTIGGALAMNAGRGKKYKQTIYDFVKYVEYVDVDGDSKRHNACDAVKGYRRTVFTDSNQLLITGAIFEFPFKESNSSNPIKERLNYAKKYQDNTGPNCGSVFKEYSPFIMRIVKGFRFGKAFYSGKTVNWLINYSDAPFDISVLILIVKLMHFCVGKKTELEVKVVD